MYLPLILFFTSLVGIIVIIGHKLVLLRNGQVVRVQHSHPFVADLEKIKVLTIKNSKRAGYVVVFVTLRFFIKSSNSIKTISKELKNKIKSKFNKNTTIEQIEKKGVSNYLKVISEYRQRIKRIKHIIKKEEGIE